MAKPPHSCTAKLTSYHAASLVAFSFDYRCQQFLFKGGNLVFGQITGVQNQYWQNQQLTPAKQQAQSLPITQGPQTLASLGFGLHPNSYLLETLHFGAVHSNKAYAIHRKVADPLEEKLYYRTEHGTKPHVKALNPVAGLKKPQRFTFTLTKAMLYPYDAETNPEGLGLKKWLDKYESEARISTAGIRGQQNILYPWDTGEQINLVGVMLATAAKARVARHNHPGEELHKIAAHEVRYNSPVYLDLIQRVQAAHRIYTHSPQSGQTIPIGLASFLAFKLDLLGGEYLTSSHGISTKLATKDLNHQGSQYLPDESMAFVNEMRAMFALADNGTSVEIPIAARASHYIQDGPQSLLARINNGQDLYLQYLKDGVATDYNLANIRQLSNKVVIDNVGGSGHETTSALLAKLGIAGKFTWFHKAQDPFFHAVGKTTVDAKGNRVPYYDWSADTTIRNVSPDGTVRYPVIETMGYEKKLKDKPIGTVVLITDPDHDRLVTTQVESADQINKLKSIGLDYIPLGGNKILTIFTPNQSFLLVMDAWNQQLKEANKWSDHPRFIIKTTASANAWDEWANANNVKVINTPVGFKELANIMKKVEAQIAADPNLDVIVTDVYGTAINLGKNPRLIAAAEESGGIVIGPEQMIKSLGGRQAISLREKGAVEPIIITASLAAQLEAQNLSLSDKLQQVFQSNNIIRKYDIRVDVNYYDENLPTEQRNKDQITGITKRTLNDAYFLSIALAVKDGVIKLKDAKEILNESFKDKDPSKTLNFDDMTAIHFVGDGTYVEFPDMCVEIRPSGTDAKTKAYAAGQDKDKCYRYASIMGNFEGVTNLDQLQQDHEAEFIPIRPKLHAELITDDYYNAAKNRSMDIYTQWAQEGLPADIFKAPNYRETWQQ
jgi:phosphomannomutase